MTAKKIFKASVVLIGIALIVLVVLANRDITKIYGGLTKRVDTTQFKPKEGEIVINNVSVLSADASRFTANQTVLIKQGKIASITPSESHVSFDAAIHVVDGSGKYLIPGLIDSHVHLFKSPNDLLLYVANGVTEIRELIGEEDHLKWKREIESGRLGPDMFIASPRIGSFEAQEGFFMEWSQGFLNISDAKQAKIEVTRLHDMGYDAVKIYSQINKPSYFAVTETAKSLGMKIVGHVPWSLEIDDIYQHHDSVAHLEELMNTINREFGGFSSKQADEFLAFVARRSDEISVELFKNEISVVTTLWLVESFVRQKFELEKMLSEVELEYENPGISEWTPRVPQGGLGWLPKVNRYQLSEGFSDERKAAIRKYWLTYAKACQLVLKSLIKNKVTMLAGTDTNLPPTVPGFSLHDEFISLNNAGMSPTQVLISATAQPAQWLGSNAGQIDVGRTANLVLLDSNPLQNIRNTKKINSVILKGRLLERDVLDQILAKVKEANDASRTVDISPYLSHVH